MEREYTGIIVEESLDDNRLLNNRDVRKLRITNQVNPKDRWHMYEVNVSKKEIEELAQHIVGDRYMHFWKGTELIAVFKDQVFEFNYERKETWGEVLAYGRSLGLPEKELDFPIKGL